MFKNLLSRGIILSTLLATPLLHANADPQELVTIGDLKITSDQLEMAVASSPFATQFVSMDVDDQAALRGDLLRRMVISRLLYLEAQQNKLDQSPAFMDELEEFRLSVLYRHYMDKLRSRIQVPEEVLSQMKAQFRGNADALTAAKSAYTSDRYRDLKILTIKTLRDKYQIKINEDRLVPGVAQETVLMEGDGISIVYADLLKRTAQPAKITPDWLREQLYKRAELLLIAKASAEEGVDITARTEAFRRERLPALLIEQKQAEWIPSDKVLKDYFATHPEYGMLAERRHIGQLVTATREDAEKFRKRIQAGESLFNIAGQYSIDPHGRSRNGDMGWVQVGRGMPQIEQALTGLADNEVSNIIETPLGFHLVTILERRPGGNKSFYGIRDRLVQAVMNENMTNYLKGLETHYQIVWHVVTDQNIKQPTATGSGG